MWLSNSSIGRKVVMSVTGLFLVLFLTFHMCMNLVALISPAGYNAVCQFLGANWYALIGTVIIAAGAVIHIIYAFWLTIQNRRARGNDRYLVNVRPKSVEWASQNMLVLGIIVVLGLALHLFNFWYKMQLNEVIGHLPEVNPHDGIALIRETFSCPVYVVIYLIWFVALWFHLTHGFWSAIQTLGINNHVWFNRWKCISNIFTTIICLGFVAVAISFYIMSLTGCGACTL
ncbi:succinate dehydrogenase/fumarate reductase cytochrome b subunit [Barnesiella viscericola]|uniref:succinate dehydrogenase/fumarate reductase cytochrome b subunit n=1 Tax=Barnesiella viscericola TaxID=397865 RepID=UPI0025A497BA|nr:succinate dehydrogenase/fumarate reductase cytochrome b subunit [Barnesiella viscericola]MDM8268447.1 succinate dehydrogenase/fumarate reductase cytochrome b subunit [Barnesiella viscericola]